MRKPPGWLIAFNVLGLMLMIAFMLMWLMLNSAAYRHKQVLDAVKAARLPALPTSARILTESHEDVFFGEQTKLSFEAPINDVHAWINRGHEVLKEESSDEMAHYQLHPKEGYRSSGKVTVNERTGRVDVEILIAAWSL